MHEKRKLFDKELFTVRSSVGKITLISLWLPILFESVMNNLQGTVNTAVLSGYSEVAVAAVGSVNTVLSVLLLFGSVLATGATVVVSNLIGAERIDRAKEAAFTALTVGIMISIILTPVLLLFTDAFMQFLHLEGALYEAGVAYFRIRIFFYVCSLLTSTVLALLKCYGYPKFTFLVGFLTNILNFGFNLFVIYCPEISPVTGAEGVAYGCGLSNLIGLLVAFFLLLKVGVRFRVPRRVRLYLSHLGRILSVGIPSGISSMTFGIVTMVTTSFVPLLGDYAINAKVYYQSILCYAYLFSVSAGNANALLVGRRFGADEFDKIEKMNKQLVRITRAVNFAVSFLIILFHRPLLGIFTSTEAIITSAIAVFAVDLLVEQARANSQVYEYALRATGDVIFTTAFVIASCIVFGLGLSYLLSVTFGMGLVGLWIGLAADEWVRAIVSYFRFKNGKWQTLHKIKA